MRYDGERLRTQLPAGLRLPTTFERCEETDLNVSEAPEAPPDDLIAWWTIFGAGQIAA